MPAPFGQFGVDPFGTSPYGSILAPFGIQSAVALNPTFVEVTFTALVDFTFAPNLDPANYSIPGLTVLHVAEQTAVAVTLIVSPPQSNIPYTVTMTSARSALNAPLDPSLASATFTGFPVNATFFAVPTAPNRVRAVFASPATNDANLSNPANYTLTDLNGSAISILSATPEQATSPTSVLLVLGANLRGQNYYQLTISSLIRTFNGLQILPATSVFEWAPGTGNFTVPLNAFSGEVSGGLFGNPAGLVFFSPALNTLAANSVIQVDEVDVCTTAFDTYHFPPIIDPPTLFTYGGSIVPTPTPDPYVLNAAVCWAPFPRNFEAQFTFNFTGATNIEPMPHASDGPCTATFREPWDHTRVGLLNNTDWKLYDHAATPPFYFITAANLTAIPPGPTVVIPLE